MPIESASFISQLDVTNPAGTDNRSTLDNHDRLIKTALTQTFPNLNSEVSATPGHMNQLIGLTANIQTQLNNLWSMNHSLSAVVQTNINNLSAALQTQLNSGDARISADLNTTIQSSVAALSATLNTSKLDLSATAVNSIYWDGGGRYFSTATASGSAPDGSVWFQYE